MTVFGFGYFYHTITIPAAYVLLCMIMHIVISHYKTLMWKE